MSGDRSGPFRVGEQVLLIDRKRRRHLIRLEAGGEFHTHAGVLDHARVIGQDEGTTVRTNRREPMVLSGRGMLEALQGDVPGRRRCLPVDHGRPWPGCA